MPRCGYLQFLTVADQSVAYVLFWGLPVIGAGPVHVLLRNGHPGGHSGPVRIHDNPTSKVCGLPTLGMLNEFHAQLGSLALPSDSVAEALQAATGIGFVEGIVTGLTLVTSRTSSRWLLGTKIVG